jgi:serine/threonine protein kinase
MSMKGSMRPAGSWMPCPLDVGPWRPVAHLGSGSGTEVHRAVDAAGRVVALKVPASADVAASVRRRLANEVTVLRRAATRGVVRVVDDGGAHRRPYLALELLAGPTLRGLVERRGPLRTTQIETIGALLADVLARVHERGVVHGDLKPANVICVDGGPVLIDFDAARQVDDDGTREMVWRGSSWWVAPEQARGDGFDRRADIFALGSLLVYLSTGRPAFGTGNPAAVLYRIVHQAPELSGVPATLRAVVDRCLDKDPAARPEARWVADHLVRSRRAVLAAA